MANPREGEHVLKVFSDPDDAVCLAAVKSLMRIQERQEVLDVISQKYAHNVSPLLKRKNPEIRRSAADLLIALNRSSNVREFISRRGDTRTQALRVLSQTGDVHDLKVIVFELKIPEVRETVTTMTIRLGVEALFEAVFRRGGPSLWRIREELLWVLTDVGALALPSLVKFVCDKDLDVEGRVFAYTAAARIGGQSAAEEARRCLYDMLNEGTRSDIIRTRRVLDQIGG
jgi:hypothetical protein